MKLHATGAFKSYLTSRLLELEKREYYAFYTSRFAVKLIRLC